MSFLKKYKLLFVVLILMLGPITLAFLINLRGFNRKFTNSSKPAPSSQAEVTFQCPSVKEFCQKGHDILKDHAYLGFGMSLEPKSPLYAAFDGRVSSSVTILSPALKEEKLNTIYLDNEQKNLRAIYYFKGDSSPSGTKVTKGQKIGLALDKINSYDTSLIFQVIKGDPLKAPLVKVDKKDFSP